MKKPAAKSKKTDKTKIVKGVEKKVFAKPTKNVTKTTAKITTKPAIKTVTKPAVKLTAKTTVKATTKTAVAKTVTKPIAKQELKPSVKSEVKTVTEKIAFKVGDCAVYPAHGVGKIEARESKTIMGEVKDFFIINILDTGMKVLVPVDNIQTVGLRKVIPSTKVGEVISILSEKKRTVISHTWNRRYREYMEKIKSGSVFEIAHVLRDLVILKSEKDLSFGERKMLDTARNLLVKELAIAKNVPEKNIEEDISKIFSEIAK